MQKWIKYHKCFLLKKEFSVKFFILLTKNTAKTRKNTRRFLPQM